MKVILYSTGCPKCQVMKKKLTNAGINYEECNDTSIMQSKGIDSLPYLEVDGTLMNFANAVKWVGEAHAN